MNYLTSRTQCPNFPCGDWVFTSSVTFPTFRQASSIIANIPLCGCSTKSHITWLLKYSIACQAIPSLLYSSCSCFRTNSVEKQKKKVTNRRRMSETLQRDDEKVLFQRRIEKIFLKTCLWTIVATFRYNNWCKIARSCWRRKSRIHKYRGLRLTYVCNDCNGQRNRERLSSRWLSTLSKWIIFRKWPGE